MDDRTSSRQMIGTLVFLIFGPVLWAANLTVIYGAQSSLCAFGALPPAAIALLIGAATLALVAAAILALIWPAGLFHRLTGVSAPAEQWPFLSGVMRLLAGLSVLAMIYFGAAILVMPTCAPLR
ncbi:hypothetical protein [Devosia sp. XK-2]|uniref:hypothetical protein n=1 Tax=Devosia sp. XK-2 TaxID=3126689 RepID=UPI0030D05260